VALLDRVVELTSALRSAGLPVSTAETVDAVSAMGRIELVDREQLRAALAATTCKRPVYRRTFDTLFDLYFPPRTGDGIAADSSADDATDGTDGPAPDLPPVDPDALRELMRAALENVLADGDEDAIRRFAREAVMRFGRADAAPGRQSWFTYRVMRQLSPQTLTASLLTLMLGEQQRGGFAEKVARQTITDRMRLFEEAVESEVRRRLAEDRGAQQIARTAIRPLAEQVEFLRASRADLVELRREVHPLARRLATRLTARRRHGRSGRLDFRRTVRASLATGGVPVVTHHKPHKPHKPELVVLCDVSGSVSSFAHFTLMLTNALREQFTRVRAFAFIDSVDEVTDLVRGDDLGEMMSKIAAQADLVWFDGHSDYGHSFEIFRERYSDVLTPKTSLLILGDGRNNHHSPAANALREIARECRHSYWLNPEPRGYWGTGDSATAIYAPLVDEMVECRNVEQLSDFVTRILPT